MSDFGFLFDKNGSGKVEWGGLTCDLGGLLGCVSGVSRWVSNIFWNFHPEKLGR